MSWFRLEKLKTLRVVLSLVFFIPITFLFLDPWHHIPQDVLNIFVSFQFIPSLLKVLVYSGLSTVGLVIILGFTIVFGRVYCSSLCPLGTLQDFIIHIGKKIHGRKHFQYKKPQFVLHYFLLAITAVPTIAGSMVLLNLFEPFSNFGRILTNIVEPSLILINNLVSNVLGRFQIYSLYNITLREFSLSILLMSIAFLGVVIYMSYKHGRLFCNTLCPAGAVLGLLSRLALFRIFIDRSSCNDCGACEKVCKANCIESNTKKIEHSACINCFNCIASCPVDGLGYAPALWQKARTLNSGHNPSRRKFFKETMTPIIGLALPPRVTSNSIPANSSSFNEIKKIPITPPGSKSIEHFSSLCTACHLCVIACPTQVLYPSFLNYGITGIFQPMMNYNASYCNYDCNVCSKVCPTGAILPIDTSTKKEIQIGKSNFVKEDCVVVTNKKDCAACSEHCPTKAVYMIPYEAKLSIPELNNEICVGCGACEHACPTTPRKAIYVSANPIHLKAKKPPVQKPKTIFDSNEEFPF